MRSAQENHTNIQVELETDQRQNDDFVKMCSSGWPRSSRKFHGTSGSEVLGRHAEVPRHGTFGEMSGSSGVLRGNCQILGWSINGHTPSSQNMKSGILSS